MKRNLNAIVCYSKNRVIGNNGRMPWNIPEDMQHFVEITTGHTLIMGRKTFESIGKPLPNRKIIVISHNKGCELENIFWVDCPENAVELALKYDNNPFVCGGAEIYQALLKYTKKIYATELDYEVAGDVKFLELDETWQEVSRERSNNLAFVIYEHE